MFTDCEFSTPNLWPPNLWRIVVRGAIPGSTLDIEAKTTSYREPEPQIPDTDEEDTSYTTPQTPSDFNPADLSHSQFPFNPEERTPNPNPFRPLILPPNMADSTTTSIGIKKNLKTPAPYSGKREDLRKFLQGVKIYLLANADAYPDDLDKILFVLSYMSEGDAASWKEEFFDTAEQASMAAGTALNLGTYKKLIDAIVKDFSPYDAPKDAIYEMKELKMGNTSVEEHVAKFKMLVTKSKLAKNDAVVEYFRETLPIPLQTKIMSLPTPVLYPKPHIPSGSERILVNSDHS